MANTVFLERVTFADLERWPDDGRRYELYDGEVVVAASPLPVHQIVVARFAYLLETYARERGGLVLTAPIDLVFTEHDVLQPDVCFFVGRRAQLVDPHRVIRHAPDLVIEILSPSTAERDRSQKRRVYGAHGVAEYWLVDPDHVSIEVFTNQLGELLPHAAAKGAGTIQSVIAPELSVDLSAIVPVIS